MARAAKGRAGSPIPPQSAWPCAASRHGPLSVASQINDNSRSLAEFRPLLKRTAGLDAENIRTIQGGNGWPLHRRKFGSVPFRVAY